jgi:hypothetical protein
MVVSTQSATVWRNDSTMSDIPMAIASDTMSAAITRLLRFSARCR